MANQSRSQSQSQTQRVRERESESQGLVDRWTKGSYPRGLFIAESGVVAALTNITTVTQFRPVDHALGGLGPPPPARPYGNGNGDGNFEYRLDCESAARAPGQGPDVGVRYEAWECHD